MTQPDAGADRGPLTTSRAERDEVDAGGTAGESPGTRVVMPSQVLAFQCTQCGDCCTGWSVPADGEFTALLEDQLRPTSTGDAVQHYVLPPPADSVLRDPVLATRSGACIFLTDAQRCGLRCRLGSDARPIVCQIYPHRQLQLSHSVSLSLDLSCRGAAHLLDRPFPPGLVTQDRPGRAEEVPPTELIDGLPLEPSLFSAVEETLIAALELPEVELDERLIVGSLLLDEVLQDVDGSPEPPLAGWSWQTAIELRPAEKIRALLRRARRQQGHAARQYLLIGRLFDLVEQWLVAFRVDDPGPFWSVTRRVRELFDLDAETGGWEERAERLGGTLASIWSERDSAVDRVLSNYVWHSLLARHLSLENGLLVGFRILAVHYALVRLHAAGLAALADETPAVHHAVRAVQVVERNFGHLPLLRRFWKRTSTINLLADPQLVPQLLLLPELDTAELRRAA